MKKILSLFLALLLPAVAAHAAGKPRNVVTSDGTTYHNATIVGATATTVMLASDEGTFNLPITSLPADMQKELNYMTPEERKKAEADKAARQKLDAAQAEADKKARLEASKHDVLPGTEKDAYPQLNPDFFPAELAPQISSYNTKAQYTSIIAGQKHTPETDATIKDNAQKLSAIRDICLGYKKFIEALPAGPDADAARKAVGDGAYKTYPGMPEIVLEAMMGVPDKVVNLPGDKVTKKVFVYGKSEFTFENGVLPGKSE